MEAAVVSEKRQDPTEITKMTSTTTSTNDTATVTKSLTARSCFSRPIPRLDGHGRIRRNSVQGSGASASESEDDTRRNTATILPVNPVRSETTVQNEKPNSLIITNNSLNLSNVVGKTKRKMAVSESARKLAEARREFQLKHENKPPDRSQLRMYDFIHYNPTTNPMKKKPTNVNAIPAKVRPPVETRVTIPSEEDTDDPTPNAMPVPQVKVGPDGQLIIDEQSLVIENTGVKESREALAKQAVIIEDNDFGNGFYKRRKKTKEWPEWETIKFYKALNIVGTDFLLMQSLFPKRGRQELKIKYKKEERMNRVLVEKALKYSQEFDIDLLKKELESFESPEKILPKSALKNNPPKKAPKQSRKRKQASRRIAAMSICEEDADDDVKYDDVDEPDEKIEKLERNDTAEMKDCDEADNESDSEIYQVRPTRSGRRPRAKKFRTYTNHALNKISQVGGSSDTKKSLQNETPKSNDKTSSPDIAIKPGVAAIKNNDQSLTDIQSAESESLVILSKESENNPGETFVKIYMMSSNEIEDETNSTKIATPVGINPDNILMIKKEITSELVINEFESD